MHNTINIPLDTIHFKVWHQDLQKVESQGIICQRDRHHPRSWEVETG